MSEDTYIKPLVLVVDDDEEIRGYLSAMIQDHADTTEAASGNKGIAIAKSRVPDLILLDLMMPGTDGYQVCKALKQNTATRHIPVIFITAQTDRTFEAAALKLGAIDYIVKPFDTDIVTTKIKNHLEAIRLGETINSTFRRRGNKRYLGIAAALFVAAAPGFSTHIYLSETVPQTVPTPSAQAPNIGAPNHQASS
ncbi:MAG: response regulator [Alphaproteobacteria bacterium]|nr:response regulator [Alphaproteobacteria bacterium]